MYHRWLPPCDKYVKTYKSFDTCIMKGISATIFMSAAPVHCDDHYCRHCHLYCHLDHHRQHKLRPTPTPASRVLSSRIPTAGTGHPGSRQLASNIETPIRAAFSGPTGSVTGRSRFRQAMLLKYTSTRVKRRQGSRLAKK